MRRILAVCLAVGLFACGSEDTAPSAESSTPTAESPTPKKASLDVPVGMVERFIVCTLNDPDNQKWYLTSGAAKAISKEQADIRTTTLGKDFKAKVSETYTLDPDASYPTCHTEYRADSAQTYLERYQGYAKQRGQEIVMIDFP